MRLPDACAQPVFTAECNCHTIKATSAAIYRVGTSSLLNISMCEVGWACDPIFLNWFVIVSIK